MNTHFRLVVLHCCLLQATLIVIWGTQAAALDAEFGLKGGYFSPENDYLRRQFGGGAAFGAEMIAWTEKEGGWYVALDYFKSHPERIDYICYIDWCRPPSFMYSMILSADISRIARIDLTVLGMRFEPYFASGLSVYRFTENNVGRSKYSEWKLGFNFLAGLQKNIFSKVSLLVDTEFCGQLGEQIPHLDGDIGGFRFCAGFRSSLFNN